MTVEPVQPINPKLVGSNFLIYEAMSSQLAAQNAKLAAQQSNTDETNEVSNEVPVDSGRLKSDQTYYTNLLRQIFYRALHHVKVNNPEKASIEFKRYFTYLWTYGGNQWNDFGTQTWGIQRYSAMFRFAQVIEGMEGSRASEKMINKELMRDINLLGQRLDPVPMAEEKIAKAFVQQSQQQGYLPTPATLSVPIDSNQLLKVAKFFQSHGFLDMAERVLAHVQLRNLMATQRAEILLTKISQRQPQGNNGLLAFPYLTMGVPMAPNLPNPYELQKQRESGEVPANIFYYTHKVTPIPPLSKDPDTEEERKKRERPSKNKKSKNPEAIENK